MQEPKYNVKIQCEFIKDAVIAKAEITEIVSNLFQCHVFLHTDKLLDINKVINQNATISVTVDTEIVRYFSGIIEIASFENVPNVISKKIENLLYIKIVPSVTRLNYQQRYKIYHEKTVQEIIQSVLKEAQISDYQFVLSNIENIKQQICVQYAESNWHFISRLLEQNGIFYYFQHKENSDKLIMANDSLIGDKLKNNLKIITRSSENLYQVNGLVNVSVQQTLGYKTVNFKSYNDQTVEVIKSTVNESQSNWKIGVSNFYDNIYSTKQFGDFLAKIELINRNATVTKLSGMSYCPSLYPGAIVPIDGSITETHNGNFFIISVKHYINQLENYNEMPVYHNLIEAIPQNTQFKPQNVHTKSRIYGCQTATVVGPEKEEVYCDKDSRVQIKFHWSNDDDKPCWVRTSQTMAGAKFGSLVIPRIGMEVLVEFVNGDPDQPLIIGCLYNGTHLPPENYTQTKNISTFYSNTIKGKGYNELRFNDQNKSEEIFIHAQKNFNKIIEDSITETLNYGSKHVKLESQNGAIEHTVLIKKGNNKVTINDGDYTVQIDKGNQKITLSNGNRKITLSNGNLSIDVTGSIELKASNDIKLEASSINIKAKNSVNVNASSYKLSATSASLKSSSSMKIDGSQTSISGSMSLKLDSSISTSISASAIVKVSGGIIKLN